MPASDVVPPAAAGPPRHPESLVFLEARFLALARFVPARLALLAETGT